MERFSVGKPEEAAFTSPEDNLVDCQGKDEGKDQDSDHELKHQTAPKVATHLLNGVRPLIHERLTGEDEAA